MSTDVFKKLDIFDGLDPDQITLLQSIFVPCDFYAETVLFEQGAPATYLYVVIYGEVMVNFKPDDGPPITVTQLGPGNVVGWSAALGSRTYTSQATCLASGRARTAAKHLA